MREARNGLEAIKEFEEWHPNLIFMDIRMAIMDGLEATRRIRTLPMGAATRIVALTAHALEEEKQNILASGFDGFVRKPYKESDVFDALEQSLGVRFVFGAKERPTISETGLQLDPNEFKKLPRNLLKELLAAAERLDEVASLNVVECISALDPILAARLRTMVTMANYKPLLAILDQVIADAPQ
jgi:CheY-like chemotaxis protein